MLSGWEALAAQGVVRQVWQAHAGPAQGIALDEAAGRIFSAGEDGRLCCWSSADGALCWSVEGHAGAPINDVAVLGDVVLTAGDDRRVRVWCAATGAARLSLEGHASAVSRLAVHPSSGVVVSGGCDGEVLLWQPGVGWTQLSAGGEWVASLVVDAAGQRVLWGTVDGAIQGWSLQARAALPPLVASQGAVTWLGGGRFVGPRGQPRGLCVLPGGAVLWGGERLRLSRAGQEDVLELTGQHTASLAVVPSSGLIAAAGEGLELWTAEGQRVAACAAPRPLLRVAASACGRWLGTVDEGGGLALWSVSGLRTRGVPTAHEYGISSLIAGPGGVVSGERRRGRVLLWTTASAAAQATTPTILPHEPGTDAVPLLALDSRRLLTASRTAAGGRLWLWDAACGAPLWQQHLPGEVLAAAVLDEDEGVVLCTDRLLSVTWSSGAAVSWAGRALCLRSHGLLRVDPSRCWVATTCRGRSPRAAGLIWRRRDRAQAGVFSVPEGASSLLTALQFSPDGVLLVGWGEDGWLHVWRRHGRRHVVAWRPHGDATGALAFSADGILHTAVGGVVRAWSLAGEALGSLLLDGTTRPVFSPQGDQVAVIGSGGEVLLADLRDGRRHRLRHSRPLERLQFSQEGTRLAGIEVGGGQVPLWSLGAPC